jgi:predicted enzyme related to lactoylglutathione lyase
MGKRTSYEPGTFSWVDLATTDPQGAKRFYGDLFGWRPDDQPVGEGRFYTMLYVGDDAAAALYEQGPEQRAAGMPPVWLSYVTVTSADESAARAKELGGAVHMEPFDVMDVGRMALLGDPTGAMLAVWQPGTSIGATRVNEPGCLTWNEIATTDPETARTFYEGLFGWSFQEMDAGGGPAYWIIGHGGAAGGRNGGMRQMSPDEAAVPPHWMPYFAVADVDATAERVQSDGGRTIAGPMDLPAGRVAAFTDPQGGAFAVFAGEFDD